MKRDEIEESIMIYYDTLDSEGYIRGDESEGAM